MKKNKQEHCKKSDCLYYDHKNFSNNCSASATQHKRKYPCHLYLKKKEEVQK
jgi:hypothetical protein